jgi:dihydroorotase
MSELITMSVKNPAKNIGLKAGELEAGKPLNAILFNADLLTEVQNEQSLFNGEKLYGKVVQNFKG